VPANRNMGEVYQWKCHWRGERKDVKVTVTASVSGSTSFLSPPMVLPLTTFTHLPTDSHIFYPS
jgi:hypothetical protein